MDYFFYIGGLTFPNNKSVLANYVSVQLFAWIFLYKGFKVCQADESFFIVLQDSHRGPIDISLHKWVSSVWCHRHKPFENCFESLKNIHQSKFKSDIFYWFKPTLSKLLCTFPNALLLCCKFFSVFLPKIKVTSLFRKLPVDQIESFCYQSPLLKRAFSPFYENAYSICKENWNLFINGKKPCDWISKIDGDLQFKTNFYRYYENEANNRAVRRNHCISI